MLRFAELESAGARLACFTGVDDGDGAGESGRSLVRAILESENVPSDSIRFLSQVHGTRVVELNDCANAEEADGAVTNTAGVPLVIRVADCVPVYLVEEGGRCAALLHAGWRGTLAGIAREGVHALTQRFGANPERRTAVIGPSAGPERYEVSEEIAARFRDAGLVARGRLADLWESNVVQLREAGVPAASIHISGIDTLADSRFYSHRRDATGGRNLAILAL